MNCQLTVLMTVYNGAPYLRTAIDSILQQTYRDFRFLIIDDASSDGSREIVRSCHDERVTLLCLDRNVGQTAALNIGLRQVSTPWIARMDQDDYSASSRLEEQMRALAADESLSCVGTFCWTFRIDPQQTESIAVYPVHYEDLRRLVLRRCPFAHSSIVVNRTALLDLGGYNERYRYCADLELYDHLLARYRAANIPKPLHGLRQHHNQGSSSKVALDEQIEIFSRRLSVNTYRPKERAMARAGLCAAYLQRVGHLRLSGRYLQLWKDLKEAFLLSPPTFFWHCMKLPIVLFVPARTRSSVKQLLRNCAGPICRMTTV